MNAKTIGIIVLSSLIIGFLIGRSRLNSDPEIKYINGDTIIDSISYPEPYEVEVPVYVELPRKTDTIIIKGDTVIIDSPDIDTTAIIADYILKRRYKEVLFDNDTMGYLRVDSEVQYNKQTKLAYTFNPITKQIEITKEPLFTPYIIGTASNLGYVGVGGGVCIKDVGVQLKYINNINLGVQGWEIGVVKKF